MRNALENDTFLFSGLKTHAQLLEASRLLLNEQGNLKPFQTFANDVRKTNVNYNKTYLSAEYEFAVNAVQMAAKWADFSNDNRYYLQYRTAKDSKVRDTHAKLDGITLPKDDPFWDSYYAPNGWNCRCNVVEVLKDKYPLSNSHEAIAQGEKATTQIGKDGRNRLEIFRFNPGKQKVIFPPTHPYSKVAGANKIKEILGTGKSNENKFVPKGIEGYEKELGININKDVFNFLKKETTFYTVEPSEYKKINSAYYHPDANFVKVPIDDRRRNSKWYAQAVIHHEFGHAIDFQTELRKSDKIKKIMNEGRKLYTLDKVKEIYSSIRTEYFKAHSKNEWDNVEKCGAILDTIASLRPSVNSAQTHSATYWKREWNPESEFIAHVSENKFSGNDIFEKIMPELYKKMVDFEFD